MNEHPQWTEQAKALLEESAHNLDAATLSRLNRARQAALAPRRAARTWFVPAGLASACALVLAVAVWHGQAQRHSGDAHGVTMSSDTPDASADDDDFFENLDFYAWLDAQDPDSDD